MKILAALALTALIATAAAQDAAKPKFRDTEAPAVVPKATPAPKDAPSKDGIGLIPETLEPAPKPKGTELKEPGAPEMPEAPQKLDKTTAAADELNERIRFRDIKTRVEREPKVVAELDRANSAKTDFEKREALRSYYTLLFGRIEKLDPSLKKRAIEARTRLSHRLDQTRIAPTEPVEPGERFSE